MGLEKLGVCCEMTPTRCSGTASSVETPSSQHELHTRDRPPPTTPFAKPLHDRFSQQVAEEAEVARLSQEKAEADKKAEAARQSKKKKGKK